MNTKNTNNQPDRFHITQDGAKKCSATQNRCPKGTRHYSSFDEAQRIYEKRMDEASRSNLSLQQLRKSMLLSKILRHDPSIVGTTYGPNGTIPVDLVLQKLKITHEELDYIVENDSKKRYIYEDNATLIRAAQGHSAAVKIDFDEAVPPETLYHGTAAMFVDSIMSQGLKPMKRQYVHLSATQDIADIVAARRENPVILTVNAKAMSDAGEKFYLSQNGVWLIKHVPPEYLSKPAL